MMKHLSITLLLAITIFGCGGDSKSAPSEDGGTDNTAQGSADAGVDTTDDQADMVTGQPDGGPDPDVTDPDVTAPTLSIESPNANGTFRTADDTIVISGVASDDVGVTRIAYTLNNGPEIEAIGLGDWSTSDLVLIDGDNTISVTAFDAADNRATDAIVVTKDPNAGVLKGIGIIGDSNSDEYQADDDRGGAYSATTINWVEQLATNRGLNFGPWDTRPSPRRTGYEYNWALSGATANSLLTQGQHTGVAQQVADGDVSLVVVYIGANDFLRQRYLEIYDGTITGGALTSKVANVISDITTAVDTVLAAGEVEILLVTIFDFSLQLSDFLAAFPDAVRRQVVTDAIRTVNTALVNLAQQQGVTIVDTNQIAADLFNGIDANGFLNVGGELIDTVMRGNEPHFLILADTHGGTISNAINANFLFMETVNGAFGTTLVPFTDAEMLTAAGIQ